MKSIVLSFSLVWLLAACSDNSSEKTAFTGSDSLVAVSSEDTHAVDVISSATAKENEPSFNGILVLPSDAYVSITLPIAGTIKESSMVPGMFLKKGQKIALVQSPAFINLQQMYLEAEAQLEYLEAEYHRQNSLAKEDAVSEKRLQQSKSDYLIVKSKYQSAGAQLRLLGIAPADLSKKGIQSYIEITAPIAGYVQGELLNTGKMFDPGQVLCEIMDKSHTLLKLIAYEKDLKNVKEGQALEFRVNGMGSETFEATLITIGQNVDKVSRSLDLYAKVKKTHPQFRPGMYVTARVKR